MRLGKEIKWDGKGGKNRKGKGSKNGSEGRGKNGALSDVFQYVMKLKGRRPMNIILFDEEKDKKGCQVGESEGKGKIKRREKTNNKIIRRTLDSSKLLQETDQYSG